MNVEGNLIKKGLNDLVEKKLIEKCLEDCISIYENDICCGIQDIEEQKNAKILLGEVIILLTKLHLGIRCCSNDNCPVNPKVELKSLFSRRGEEIKELISYKTEWTRISNLVSNLK